MILHVPRLINLHYSLGVPNVFVFLRDGASQSPDIHDSSFKHTIVEPNNSKFI